MISRVFHLCRVPIVLMCVGLHGLFFLALPWIHAHLEVEHSAAALHAHSTTRATDGLDDAVIHDDDDEVAEFSIATENFSHSFHSGVRIFPYASSRLVDLQLAPSIANFIIPANLLYPPVLAIRPSTQIVLVCPLRPLSSGERARLVGTDLPPPTS